MAIFSQPGYHGEWNHSSEQVLSHTPLAFTVIYCLHILQYLTVQWCEEVFAPFLIYFFWGSICHTFQIIKHIYILEKDNASKHNAVSKWKCLLWRGGGKPTWPSVNKSLPSPNLITGCSSLNSNSFNQAFAITGNEPFTALWRNFAPLSHSGGFPLEMLWCCHSISVGFRPGLSLSHSKVFI